MIKLDKCTITLGVMLAFGGITYAEPAAAQATRTWVSGVGDDANPCSRTAPCKTFAGAISKTAPGGEINCLDPGGFGGVTITKSLAIVCDFTEAGVLVTGGSSGIIINAGPTDVVYLSGLDIQGIGTGGNGVRFVAGASLHIHNSLIRGFNFAGGNGVNFAPSGPSQLTIDNTQIFNNGSAGGGAGLLIKPTGTGGARVTLRNVNVHNNLNNGLLIDLTGLSGAQASLLIDECQFIGNVGDGVRMTAPAGTGNAAAMLTDSVIALNAVNGLTANGPGVRFRVAGTSITANQVGVSLQNGGIANTYGTNRNDGNGTDGTFTQPPIPQE
jgi:hypothetical protein